MKSWFKKQMAVLLTLVLAFSVTIPVSAEGTDESVQTVTVTLSGQAEGAFLFAPGEYTISSNEAEKFGYKDAEGGVTTLDALVYAHEIAIGKEFTKETKEDYLQVADSGWILLAFGGLCQSAGFKVNDILPYDSESDYNESYGYTGFMVNQAIIHDGDDVVFFSYSSAYDDLCTWFEKDGEKVTNLKLEENSAQQIQLKGYSYMQNGSKKEEDIKANTNGIKDAQLTLTKAGTMESKAVEAVVTDENGNVVLSGLTKGEYYLSAYVTTGNGATPIIMPICKLQVVSIKDNIAATYTQTTDPWTIIDMSAYGQQDKLVNEDKYIASAKEIITNTEKTVTDKEKAIIALSGLGYDVSNLDIDGEKVNAISKLLENKITNASVYAYAYGLNAVDSGKYCIPSNAYYGREQLVKNILELQTVDKGWTWSSDLTKQDTDTTGMVLPALAPYYLADNAEEAELTEATYKNVKTAVNAAVDMLSTKQGSNGSYGSANTDAMVIVALSSLGIDANKDSRFVKEGNGLYDGMLQYMMKDYSGFWYGTNKKVNDLATEQAFRALVAYSKMKESGKPYNVYDFSDPSVSRVKLNVNSKEMTVDDTFTLQTQVLPEIATNKEVTYETSDATVAEVSEKGVVTAKKAGTATIKVISKEDNTRTATCEIVVKDKKVEPTPTPDDKKDDKTEVTTEATTEATTETTTEAPAKVNYSKIPLQTGKKTNVIQINGGKTKIKKATVSNKKIVSVTVKNGKLQIKAKKKGKAVITITDENGQVSKVTVEVKKSVPLKKLSLNKKKVTLKVNQKEKLVVTKNPVTAVTKLKWSTSDKKIVTVDQNGKVKAKKKGKVTITVKASNGKKARCKVTVK